MGQPFEFERSIGEGGLRTYRYLAAGSRLFDHSWPGLYDEWQEFGPTPFTEFAVNNNNREEIAVYLGFIWRLTEGLMPFVLPRYHRDDVMYVAGAPYALVDWEYEVETEDFAQLGRINGFVPARSSVRIHPPPSPWEQEHAQHAGLFEVPVFSILVGVLRQLLGDATAELNLYAVSGQESTGRLVNVLQSPTAPQLADCLAPGEILIDLAVQVDAEYGDSIVVHTFEDLDDRLTALAAEYQDSIAGYESEVAAIASVGEFNDRMRELIALGEYGGLSRYAGWQ